MRAAKWTEGGGEVKAASPAVECVRLLGAPERAAGVKGEGMRAKQESQALVERNDYAVYSMADVDPLPDHKVVLSPGEFHVLRAHYNIRTDPDLGLGWVALRRVACGCAECAAQLALPWKEGIERDKQPRYARNKACARWPSYEGANDWKIRKLLPKTAKEARAARASMSCVLSARMARTSLQIVEGEVGVYGTSADDTRGYYVVVWRGEPYNLQEETNGMAIGTLVADADYFNPVDRAPGWYTPSPGNTTVVDVAHVLRTGLVLLPLSDTNKLPGGLAKAVKRDATEQRAAKVDPEDHEAIMAEALKRDRLDYDESESESESEDEGEDEPETSEDEE